VTPDNVKRWLRLRWKAKMERKTEMPTLRVSDRTWGLMKALAQPFEKPDDMLARVLAPLVTKFPESSRSLPTAKPSVRRSTAGHMRSPDFREPIVTCLRALGGKATVPQVRKWLEQHLGNQFTDRDREILSVAQEPRWWKNAAWERNNLAQEGILRADSPRGVWELADTASPDLEGGS
jgi:hypothetical protein